MPVFLPPVFFPPRYFGGAYFGLNGTTGEISGEAGHDYPFVGPPVRAPYRGLFADAFIIHDQSDIPTALRTGPADATVYLETFNRDGDDVVMILKWGDDSVFIDTTAITPKVAEWGTWRVMEWISGTKIVRITLDVTRFDELDDPREDGNIHLPFCIHCVWVRTRRLRRIRVSTTRVTPTAVPFADDPIAEYIFTGTPEIVAGYNVKIDVLDKPEIPVIPGTRTEIRKFKQVQFNVIPGAGQGKYPGCDDQSLYIRLINGQRGDKRGNIIMDPRDCYWLERRVELEDPPSSDNPRKGTLSPGVLYFHNDCKACADCADYAQEYKRLRTVYERAANLDSRFKVIMLNYAYYLKMIGALKEYIDQNEVDLTVAGSESSVVTIRVSFKSGSSTYKRVQVSITPPAGYTLEYAKKSGWEKVPGRKGRAADALLSPSAGMGFTVERNFPINSLSWWEWAVNLKANTPNEGDPGSHAVQFSMTVNATNNNDPALPTTQSFGPVKRSTDIIY